MMPCSGDPKPATGRSPAVAANENVLLVFTKYPAPGFAKTRLIPALGADRAAEVSRALTARAVGTVRQYVDGAGGGTAVDFCVATPVGVSAHEAAVWLTARPPLERVVEQVGAGLGQRLAHAFCEAFEARERHALGDHTTDGTRARCRPRVVVVGTDIPDLGSKHLEEAYRALDRSDLVIGPAVDGGYYLLGASTFIPELFEDVPWSTDTVLTHTLNKARVLGLSVHVLSTLRDIDTPQDLPYLEEFISLRN